MRFVSLANSLVGKARRAVSQAASVHMQTDEDKAPNLGEVAKVLRQMMLRVNKLEAALGPEPTEFEVVVSTGGALVELVHNFNGPVRWWVTAWSGGPTIAGPVASHSLVQDTTSTSKVLFLRSYVAGKAVVRVELSQSYIEVL